MDSREKLQRIGVGILGLVIVGLGLTLMLDKGGTMGVGVGTAEMLMGLAGIGLAKWGSSEIFS